MRGEGGPPPAWPPPRGGGVGGRGGVASGGGGGGGGGPGCFLSCTTVHVPNVNPLFEAVDMVMWEVSETELRFVLFFIGKKSSQVMLNAGTVLRLFLATCHV